MFRLPDQAALDAMLKRTHVRVVRPTDMKQDAPVMPAKDKCQCGKPMTFGSKTCVDCYRAISKQGRPKIDYVGVLVRQIARGASLEEALLGRKKRAA